LRGPTSKERGGRRGEGRRGKGRGGKGKGHEPPPTIWRKFTPMVIEIRLLISLQQTDGQRDGQTPHDGITAALCIASRGNQVMLITIKTKLP